MGVAMILCAGLGTRLRPLSEWLAKPMVPIGDAPAVEHVARHLRAGGIDRIVVNVHHRASDVRAWAEKRGIAVSEEVELLGTAGGVGRADPVLGDGDVLVWNGDILCELDAGALRSAHVRAGAEATLAVVPRPAGEGNVGIGEDGRVVRLRRQAFGRESRGGDFVGIQVLGRAMRRRLPERGCLVGDVLIPALESGARIAAHEVTCSFVDVGSVAAYAAANRAWLSARGLSSWQAPDAFVRASVAGSIVGAGARIEADAIDCVVWPDARVTERVERAVVTPHGTVPVPGSSP
jgi:mannose-1-phosphate guanylyltransferase